MKNQNAARKVQEVIPTMTIVEPTAKETSAKVINFKASAEITESEEVKEKPIAPETTSEQVITQQATEQPIAIAEKPKASIEEIKRKNEVLSRLTAKYDNLNEKRRNVEDFSISHDGDSASVRVRDAHGQVFESNSPKTIGKLIEFWKEEFKEAIEKVEAEIREIA